MNSATIVKAIKRLPAEEQREVFDFIDFLSIRRSSQVSTPLKRGSPSIATFIGMWRNRSDMIDSTSWVRRQRRTGWNDHV